MKDVDLMGIFVLATLLTVIGGFGQLLWMIIEFTLKLHH